MSQTPYFSFWEIESYLSNVDLVIVGGGIVGLTTAIHCALLEPKLSILVLERGALPSGASTKNAGFACFGSASELLADLNVQSQHDVFERVARRIDGLRRLRSLLGDKSIEYNACGGFELFGPQDEALFAACHDFIRQANKELEPLTLSNETYVVEDSLISKFGFKGVNHVIYNRAEGAIHTGKMMLSLTSKAREMGVSIITGLGVESAEEGADNVGLTLSNGYLLLCKHMHIATNGFAKELMPEIDTQPARAQVLITSPIQDLQFNGTFHMDEGYYYFRNVGNRILLGGGRNLDFNGEQTTVTGISEVIQSKLEDLLKHTIAPNAQYHIEHRWSGTMGIGGTKDTLMGRKSPNITYSVRMGGMGVALGTLVGAESAEMILGKNVQTTF